MDNKIFRIIMQIFALLILWLVIYVLCVFLFPDFADNYGNADWNTQIRQLKESSLQISSPDGSLNLPL